MALGYSALQPEAAADLGAATCDVQHLVVKFEDPAGDAAAAPSAAAPRKLMKAPLTSGFFSAKPTCESLTLLWAGTSAAEPSATLKVNNGAQEANAWTHVHFGGEDDGCVGELWLSREVGRRGAFVSTSLTTSQALATALILRFKCPPPLLSLLEAPAT